MSTPSQVAKCYKTLPLAVDDTDLEDVDELRGQIPFRPSRSKFGCGLLRYAIASVKQGTVTVETIGSKYSEGPVNVKGGDK